MFSSEFSAFSLDKWAKQSRTSCTNLKKWLLAEWRGDRATLTLSPEHCCSCLLIGCCALANKGYIRLWAKNGFCIAIRHCSQTSPRWRHGLKHEHQRDLRLKWVKSIIVQKSFWAATLGVKTASASNHDDWAPQNILHQWARECARERGKREWDYLETQQGNSIWRKS